MIILVLFYFFEKNGPCGKTVGFGIKKLGLLLFYFVIFYLVNIKKIEMVL